MPAVRYWHVPAASALLASSVIAVTPAASPPDLRVADLDVRLTSSGPLDDITTFLASAGTQFSDFVNSGISDLNNLGIGSFFEELNKGLDSIGSLFTTSGQSILNFPYQFVADIINIPHQWSLALQEYAYALGPAGSVGGVAGRIPPGIPPEGISTGPDGQDYYAVGGTGSWWSESIGNTWGWDDGNWPQVDGIGSFLLPFNWAQNIANLVQGIMQAESIDGSQVNCEFECVSFLDYLGQWFKTPLSTIFSPGYTYPPVPADTVGHDIPAPAGPGGADGPGVINNEPTGTPDDVIWSGQAPNLSLSDTMSAIWNDWTAPASANPIEIPNPLDALQSAVTIFGNIVNDFDPFVTGSFLYWGAPTLYSIPALITGLLSDFTGHLLPNPFGDPTMGAGQWQPNGAEPEWGFTAGPSSLLSSDHGLAAGFQYLFDGLQKFLDPSTWESGAGGTGAVAPDLSAVDPTGGADAGTLSADLSALLSQF